MPFITVRNFSQMSEQTIFDKAVKHIGTTGKQSKRGESCTYTGSGCNAAPFLMLDKLPKKLNGQSWGTLLKAKLVPETHALFMDDLQFAHDNVERRSGKAFKKGYDEEMRVLAFRCYLNTKELDALGWDKL